MVFGLFKKDRDTSQIETILGELHRLGRRMGGLASMTDADRANVIRVFKLDVILDSVRGMKSTLLDAHRQVSSGKVDGKSLRNELGIFGETITEYHHYLDVVNEQATDEIKFFVERPGIESYF